MIVFIISTSKIVYSNILVYTYTLVARDIFRIAYSMLRTVLIQQQTEGAYVYPVSFVWSGPFLGFCARR